MLCNGRIEFSKADFDRGNNLVTCPHCSQNTTLFIPEPVQRPPKEKRPFITTTGNEISGWVIESYVGVVRGIVVRSPDLLQGMFGGLKTIVGGNIESYAKVCEHARQEAFARMLGEAYKLQADAVIAFRYDATEFSPGVTEVLAYGTAVKLASKTA